ncbi:MAG TPA: rhomboid family intramembrane serine protease [Candidatus Udaeobacter sp.]|jgi:rhomboid protease GluP|nr:rhomboid family intramembrane serine protease [Candidatus Udaeobacter sp.]
MITNRRWTIALVLVLLGVFGLELATHSVGNDDALLRLGALPDNGKLQGQYWRLAAYSFLHFNGVHLLVNASLLFWIGGILERRMGAAVTGAIYLCSVLSSAFMILLVHSWHPKIGATVGASGGMFGLVGATLLISYRDMEFISQTSRLRPGLWLVLLIGFSVSFLPEISMAGHVGGLIGGLLAASFARLPKEA